MSAPVPATFAFTVDALYPAGDASSGRERALWASAASGLMDSPDPSVCRENALALVARLGAVDRVAVVFVGNGERAADAVDWYSGKVDIRRALSMDIAAPRHTQSAMQDFRNRCQRLGWQINLGHLPGARLVLVDRALSEPRGRKIASDLFHETVGELVLIDPSPWGLSEAAAIQICEALEVDPPLYSGGLLANRVDEPDPDDPLF